MALTKPASKPPVLPSSSSTTSATSASVADTIAATTGSTNASANANAANNGALPTQQTLPAVITRLQAAQTYLLGRRGYLAEPAVLEDCEWVRDGKAHKLVFKTPPAPPVSTVDSNESTLQDTIEVPQLAKLCLVGRISKDDFWLLSDAGWRGTTEFSKSFAKVKASGTWEAPRQAPFAADFPSAIKNLKAIEAKMVTPGFKQTRSTLVGLGGSRVKVRHALFEVSYISSYITLTLF